MKLIRLAAVGAALFVGVSATASAQQPSPCSPPPAGAAAPAPAPGGRGGRGGIGPLLKDITLTAEQVTKCEAIVAKAREEMQAARGTGGAMDDAARAKMQEIQQKQVKDLREILTADQQKTFDKNVADRAAAMQRPPQA